MRRLYCKEIDGQVAFGSVLTERKLDKIRQGMQQCCTGCVMQMAFMHRFCAPLAEVDNVIQKQSVLQYSPAVLQCACMLICQQHKCLVLR